MLSQTNVVIADTGTTQTGVLDLRAHILVGISMPSDWDAADITFTASGLDDEGGGSDGVYSAVTDANGDPVLLTVAASTFIAISPNAFQGTPFVKLVASAAQSPARTIKCLLALRSEV